jgi:exopolysaccharide biosynthesis polyprenyl glycosylphosphotransferase
VISRFYYYGFLLRVSVYSLPALAFAVVGYLRFGNIWISGVPTLDPQHYWILLLFTELVWMIAAHHSGLSSVREIFREFTGIRAVALASLPTLLFQTALLGSVKELSISRIFLFSSDAVLFVSALVVRNFFRLTSEATSWPPKREKILVVGTDQYASRSVRLLSRVPFSRFEVQAYLHLPSQPEVVRDAPIIECSDVASLGHLDFDEIIVAIPPQRYMQVASILETLQDLGKPVRVVLDFGARVFVRETFIHFGRMQMMSLALSPTESFAYTIVKRVFDLLGAITSLVILSPALLLIAVLVKLSSPGPAFFRQQRVGRNGTIFTLFKFRTMHCSGGRDGDTVWTTKNDCRCTPLGVVLRRFSLDELPQLLNVIRGEMSLVGPRPERPYYVAKFRENIERYNRRHCCQVGMTGLAQVNGLRGDTSIPERLRYDLYYMRHWSIALDLRILLRTISVALRGENAY